MRLFGLRAGKEPPVPSPAGRKESLSLEPSVQQTALIVLILVISFSAQGALLDVLPWLKQGYLPVIVLAYLFRAGFRLSFETLFGGAWFPEQSISVLPLGPTMGIVLAYAIMSVPLHTLGLLTAPVRVLRANPRIPASPRRPARPRSLRRLAGRPPR
jgi:Na+/glutamate symporter